MKIRFALRTKFALSMHVCKGKWTQHQMCGVRIAYTIHVLVQCIRCVCTTFVQLAIVWTKWMCLSLSSVEMRALLAKNWDWIIWMLFHYCGVYLAHIFRFSCMLLYQITCVLNTCNAVRWHIRIYIYFKIGLHPNETVSDFINFELPLFLHMSILSIFFITSIILFVQFDRKSLTMSKNVWWKMSNQLNDYSILKRGIEL